MGGVKGCESLYTDEFIEGNIRQDSLSAIWHNKDNFAYNRHFDKNSLRGKCGQCNMGEFCRGGCKGISYFNKGHFFENPYCIYNAGE